ncbi:hypothetical protein H0H92_000169 [Tricholoma furcatifolium]|nr:hypothetical protein H0H92_000169 [Tricholoma furcatifolium]
MFPRTSLTQVVTILLCSAAAVQGMAPTRRTATVCNGYAELCDKSYGEIAYVGTHDSYAIQTGSYNFAVNQDQNITTQLNDGVRMLQVQAHLQNNVLELCHTSCSLYDGGSLQTYLTTVKKWLDANPNEVVSLLIVNIDNAPVSTYGTVYAAAGVDTYSYAPASSPIQASAWPTLGSMIDSGTRLVTFLDNQANLSSVPYILDEFTNVWETAYDVTNATLFDCAVNRTQGDTTTQMYLINHFLDQLVLGEPVPDISEANVTNAATGAGSLGAQVDTCTSVNGRAPNFLLVDFYEYGGGSVFEVAASINGVTYAPTTPIATPLPATASSTATGSVSTSPAQGSGALTATPSQSLLQAVVLAAGVLFGACAPI